MAPSVAPSQNPVVTSALPSVSPSTAHTIQWTAEPPSQGSFPSNRSISVRHVGERDQRF
eukprot:gene20840-26727_t